MKKFNPLKLTGKLLALSLSVGIVSIPYSVSHADELANSSSTPVMLDASSTSLNDVATTTSTTDSVIGIPIVDDQTISSSSTAAATTTEPEDVTKASLTPDIQQVTNIASDSVVVESVIVSKPVEIVAKGLVDAMPQIALASKPALALAPPVPSAPAIQPPPLPGSVVVSTSTTTVDSATSTEIITLDSTAPIQGNLSASSTDSVDISSTTDTVTDTAATSNTATTSKATTTETLPDDSPSRTIPTPTDPVLVIPETEETGQVSTAVVE